MIYLFLRILVVWDLVNWNIINCTLHLSKDQPEDDFVRRPKHVAEL